MNKGEKENQPFGQFSFGFQEVMGGLTISVLSANIGRDFTARSDGLVAPHQVPLRYLPEEWRSRLPQMVIWVFCAIPPKFLGLVAKTKSVMMCFVKSFPNIEPTGINTRETEQEQDSAAPPTAIHLTLQSHVFGNRLHFYRHQPLEQSHERSQEGQLSPAGQTYQERTATTLRCARPRHLQPLLWPVPTDTHPLHPGA